jgi:hypothetical protein
LVGLKGGLVKVRWFERVVGVVKFETGVTGSARQRRSAGEDGKIAVKDEMRRS